MATTVTHRLHYFHLRSRGEIIRLVYAYGRVPYEEVTVPTGRPFMAAKPNFPFQQLPIVEIGDVKYAGSSAVARFMAKQLGLYPMEDHLAALEVDMIVEGASDLMSAAIAKNFLERDEARKAKQTGQLNKYILPAYLSGLQARVPATATPSNPYFLGKISLADIAVFNVLANIFMPEKEDFPMDLEKDYPKLVDIMDSVRREPGIAEYLANEESNRPVRPPV